MTTQRHHAGLMLAHIKQATGFVGSFVAIVLLPLWIAIDYSLDAQSLRTSKASTIRARVWSYSLPFNRATALLSYDPAVQERAFMEAIAHAEGNAAYNELYGHEEIGDLTRHPNRCKPIHVNGYEQLCTTAAGRWQITADTWYEYAERLNVRDFSPASQYRVAVAIARDTGALTLLSEGNVIGAMKAASHRWASLPHNSTNQSRVSEKQFLRLYERSLIAELESR